MSFATGEGCYAWAEIYERLLNTGGKEQLGLRPFVGPLEVRFAPGRGRGLFATANVRRGQLLLCAGAVVVGDNASLPSELGVLLSRNASLRDVVLALSRGLPCSEKELLFSHSLEDLACPNAWATKHMGSPSPVDAVIVAEVLRFNQFALSSVSCVEAQVQVNSDLVRSGLWLLPSFLNHSCRPNVQRVLLHDWLVIRAARDLCAGEELVDCYTEALQPLHRRRAALQRSYRFQCSCERCCLEMVALDSAKVKDVFRRSDEVGASTQDASGHAQEAVLQAAEDLVIQGLAQCLDSGFEVGATLLEGEGSLKTRLRALLLGSFGPIFRSQAVSLQANGPPSPNNASFRKASAVWARFAEIVGTVLPCSEVKAATSSSLFCMTLMLHKMDFLRTCRPVFVECLQAFHDAYGGGVEVWLVWHRKMFPAEILDAARDVLTQQGLTDDGQPPQQTDVVRLERMD
eukprot:TRINITY_DN26720_c0_g1_i1.p1 TRINITY_DN26720_c0_g1~~TRINITY_DN26720_c0_g1_i1.p1  ORF type:complete len:459 (+),score=63.79 TRINITY_DN26720_c0_g1_i1:50-1426(+)